MARKILLADDSVTAQNMGRKILADAGYEVVAVNNGSAALKRVAEQRPDLIVLDVYMPGYSGLEVCQRLKETNDTARIPVLLTVGKLEPFKPEEAKRVRADAFIVKPFEASELLSALTKLEDKIVPVSEGSKPGRFARAIAAVEEGRYVADDDSGWKNRINFPSKKKQKTEEKEESDDAAIYNPVNKDLRTIVDHQPPAESKASDAQAEPKGEDSRVDLGALAPEGLPKDVTPEEIAALAAAAARVKGTVEEHKEEQKSAELIAAPPQPLPHAEADKIIEAKAVTPDVEDKAEGKIESAQPSVDARNVGDHTGGEHNEVAAGFERQEKKESELVQLSASASASSIPAVSEAQNTNLETSPFPESVSSSANAVPATETPSDEPVTMAAALQAEPAPARWSAVSVAPSSDEIALQLEHEMQKAYAALAAAEAPATAVDTLSAPIAAVTNEASALAATATLASQSEAAPNGVSETETASRAVREFEKIAAPQSESVSYATPAPEPSGTQLTASDQLAGGDTAELPPALASQELQASPSEVISKREFQGEKHAEKLSGETSYAENARVADVADVAAPIDSAIAEPMSAPEVINASIAPPLTSADEHGDSAKESEIAATTAAAWASWRRIRSDSKDGSVEPSGPPHEMTPQEAAMAVAAGAEKAPEEAASSEEESGEIASIVDSVLADLRPKIVEEISRKLGKKK